MPNVFVRNPKISRTPPESLRQPTDNITPQQDSLQSQPIIVNKPVTSPQNKITLTPQLLHSLDDFQDLMEPNEPLPSTSRLMMDEEGWTISGKRGRVTSPLTQNNKCKQMKINDYWLAQPVSISTRFNDLLEETKEQPQSTEVKKIIAPPIFVSGVETIQPLTELLKQLADGKYDLKIIGSSQVKIQLKDADTYPAVVKALAERKTEFHSFQAKMDKTYKAVIRNLHPSINTDDLKNELIELGHDVVHISNIRQSGTKKPLPLFQVELRTKENNKDIHSINRLMYSVVQVEKPHVKREVVQCTTCQRYGHTKTYCNRRPRCVKCAGEHLTNQCERKEWGTEVKCVLCSGSHPANYRGCSVYKEVQTRRFPSLRTKIVHKSQDTTNVNPNPSYGLVNGVTYAEKLKETTSKANITNENQQTDNMKNQEHQGEQSSILRLENMMEKLMCKMDTILNLLTTIVSKTYNVQNA